MFKTVKQIMHIPHSSIYIYICVWYGRLKWLERRVLNRENPGSNPLAVVSKL